LAKKSQQKEKGLKRGRSLDKNVGGSLVKKDLGWEYLATQKRKRPKRKKKSKDM